MGSLAFAFAILAASLTSAWAFEEHTTPAEKAILIDMYPNWTFHEHPPPPKVPDWLLKEDNHLEYTRWNLQNPEYKEWIRTEMVPTNHKYEEFAYTRDWAAFTKQGASKLDPNDVVVVVTCSPSRLPFVRRMLKHWQGPMALTIFIPHTPGTDPAAHCRQRLLNYGLLIARESTAPFALSFIYAHEDQVNIDCNVDEHSTGLEPGWIDRDAWAKKYKDKEFLTIFDGLYPTNHARNVVVNMIQSNAFVFLVDADFVPSGKYGELYNSLKKDPALKRIRDKWNARHEREVLIIPAFERLRKNLHHDASSSECYPETDECWLYEKVDVPYTKEKLVKMVNNEEIESFYHTRYGAAYDCYLPHERWLYATQEYTADVLPECEPYIIGLKDAMPPYDDRFRGYQCDKVSFLQHVTILGTKYTVHPTFFIIHLPHHKSYSVDDGVDKRPAMFDKWTVARVLESIAVEEKATATARDALLKGSVPPERAEFQAKVIGREYARLMTEYRLKQLGPQNERQRVLTAQSLQEWVPKWAELAHEKEHANAQRGTIRTQPQ